jgi:hypothetical protein
MPSIYTHNYFAKDLYKNRLEKIDIYKINNKQIYEIFAQSFDNLFYYNFLSIKNGKKYRKFGHYAHTHKVWLYFKNLIEYIKENNLYDDENLGYLYGSLTHYCLDSTCHPYIHYISGRLNKSDYKHTKQYIGNHAINEIMIDSIYYYKTHDEKYYKYKLCNDIIPKIEFSENLLKTMNHTFKKTFNKDNIGEIYNKSYNQSHLIYKYLMYDRFGIKKVLYKIFDAIVFHKNFKAYSYSHHIDKPNYEVLNLNHETWHHPITNEKHNESFEDLYEIAAKKCEKMIKKCNDYFKGKCKIEDVEKVIGNISYSSGLDASLRVEFQYFKI